jgi:hypothetical protein
MDPSPGPFEMLEQLGVFMRFSVHLVVQCQAPGMLLDL